MGVLTHLHKLILCAIIYVMTTISSSETPANRLASTLSNDKNKQSLFVDYFQGQSSDSERQATLDQIVDILHEDNNKLKAFFEALDDIFQLESLTEAQYGSIEAIVGALFDKGKNMFDQVSSLARKNPEWGQRLLDFLYHKSNNDSRGFMFVFNQPNSDMPGSSPCRNRAVFRRAWWRISSCSILRL